MAEHHHLRCVHITVYYDSLIRSTRKFNSSTHYMSNLQANGDWKPVASVNGLYDFNSLPGYYPPSTTRKTVTTTYEYDENGKVTKMVVVEETITSSDTYRVWNGVGVPIY